MPIHSQRALNYQKMKKIIKRNYKRMTQDKANSFANVVYLRMKDDPKFADFAANVTELKVRNTAFEVADGNAADGGKKLTIIKNECFDVMIEQLDEVADQIEYVAKGNEKLALDAGFELVPEVKSINAIAPPTGLKAENNVDRSGVVNLKWKADKNAVNYGIEYQKEGETTWRNGTSSTSSSAILAGLEAGFYYNIRIYANGRKQLKSDATDYVTVLVS